MLLKVGLFIVFECEICPAGLSYCGAVGHGFPVVTDPEGSDFDGVTILQWLGGNGN